MRIDLHTHSRVSDGTAAPRELVRAAAEQGVDVLALTDHDTTAGWDEAVAAAHDFGVSLVRGIEVSTRFRDSSVHLLAYLPDPDHPPLARMLGEVLAGREARVPRTVARLQELGVEVEEADVRAAAGSSAAAGRPHVADALVARGVVEDRTEAFRRFLHPGRPAYVGRETVELDRAVRTVAAAGGVTVLAHPWGRTARDVLDEAAIARLATIGLTGLEVDHLDHDAAARAELAGLAGRLGLVVTGGSDHHGTGKRGHDLGCERTDPDQFERLLDAAAEAARTAGRSTPEVVWSAATQ